MIRAANDDYHGGRTSARIGDAFYRPLPPRRLPVIHPALPWSVFWLACVVFGVYVGGLL